MIRIATLNLLHFAAPPIWWYRRDPDAEAPSQFSEAAWRAKCAWLRETLARTDADVIGFQEVVSVDALRALVVEAGYPHFFAAAEPRFVDEPEAVRAQQGAIYDRPVQAIASRYPMQAEALSPPPNYAATLGLPPTWAHRRPPVKAVVELPGFGQTLVYCCHFKSHGADDNRLAPEDETDSVALAIDALTARSRGHCRAAAQRAAEASAMAAEAAMQLSERPERPLIVLGDLNDEPHSVPLRALLPEPPGSLPDPVRAAMEPLRLFDAATLLPVPEGRDTRAPTHRWGAEGSVLDYICVSTNLRSGASGTVVAHRVDNAHFRRAVPEATSDHAVVSVDLEAP
ncbi:MAG: endonuclease/exonuclease/phosphatase family protein [Pseudomonadota bacterium]